MDGKTRASRAWGPEKALLDSIGRMPEWVYLTLLCVYLSTFLMLKTWWTSDVSQVGRFLRSEYMSLSVWACAIYLFFVLVSWGKLEKKPVPLAVVAVVMMGLTGYLRTRMSETCYIVTLDMFFCVMAYKKDYKKILKCVMWMAFIWLLLTFIGEFVGLTQERVKGDNVSPGHSFGIVYPNTWGYISFMGLLPMWVLYLRKKTAATFGVFWGMSLFLFFVVSCRTVAALTLIFPVAALLAERVEARPPKEDTGVRILKWVLILAPFLVYAFSLILAWNMEWLHRVFYNTPFKTLAMRFVQGGVALTLNGIPLFGHPIIASEDSYVMLNGEMERLWVMDNAYITYTIKRGLLWIVIVLIWLCVANWKCIKKRDYRLLTVGCIFLIFAMMEETGLNMWVNSFLLYPLAMAALPEEAGAK